jgi:ADP-ribosylglycohydrolase
VGGEVRDDSEMTGAMHEAIVVDQHKKILMLRAALIALLATHDPYEQSEARKQAIDALDATRLKTDANTLQTTSGL